MNRNTLGLGSFAARGIIILTILLITGFILQLVIIPDRGWIPAKTSYYTIDTSGNLLGDFCGVVYFLQTPLILVLFACLHDYSSGSLKIFSSISLSFIVSFTALRVLSYIIQFTIKKLNIHACDNDCLLYHIHSLVQSSASAIDVITMTVFLGLAQLFIIPVFSKTNKIEKNIRLAFFIAGIINLISVLMFILNISGLLALAILISYLFFNVALLLLLKFFRQHKLNENEG